MLASLAEAPLVDARLAYERKYDGIRVIADIDVLGHVRLWSRLGNDKTAQFPEVAEALRRWARRKWPKASKALKESKGQGRPIVLDGEIVALDVHGEPAGFQRLQERIHALGRSSADAPSAFVAFDLLRLGDEALTARPWRERRDRLEQVLGEARAPTIRLSDVSIGDGRALMDRARREGWEGLVVKDVRSRYRSGRRTPDWRKLKICHRQEFIVAGWTEPRGARRHFGALLLAVSQPTTRANSATRLVSAPGLVYAGRIGTGFSDAELERVMARLRPLESNTCPCDTVPRANARAHWVTPSLIADVEFAEWTADGLLRHPVYVGLRDDKNPRDVRREEPAGPPRSRSRSRRSRTPPAGAAASSTTSTRPAGAGFSGVDAAGVSDMVSQVDALEKAKKNGHLVWPDGRRLSVTNVGKILWPKERLTKGDLFRHYLQVAPHLLPVLADRPLVMKRYPNEVVGEPFYQHRTPQVPMGVRLEQVEHPDPKPQLVGGDLVTLLYTAQLAAISRDPWFSRVQSWQYADYAALDLDPMPGVSFATVLDVARWIHDELESLGVIAFPKTSGADGLHIFIPLRPNTPYEAGLLFCQIVATLVSDRHPKAATVERAVRSRGARVCVDYLQNIAGKTLASAYSARATQDAGVSAPLMWPEVHGRIRREDFTIRSMPARLRHVGDLWRGLRTARGVDLGRAIHRLGSRV